MYAFVESKRCRDDVSGHFPGLTNSLLPTRGGRKNCLEKSTTFVAIKNFYTDCSLAGWMAGLPWRFVHTYIHICVSVKPFFSCSDSLSLLLATAIIENGKLKSCKKFLMPTNRADKTNFWFNFSFLVFCFLVLLPSSQQRDNRWFI